MSIADDMRALLSDPPTPRYAVRCYVCLALYELDQPDVDAINEAYASRLLSDREMYEFLIKKVSPKITFWSARNHRTRGHMPMSRKNP